MELLNSPEWQQRPMTVSEILARVWQILRAQLQLFLKLGVVPMGAMVLTYALAFGGLFAMGIFPPPSPAQTPRPAQVAELVALMLCAMVPIMLAYALYEAAAMVSAMEANRGRAASFASAYRMAWDIAGRLIWLMILRCAAVMLPMMLVMGLFFGALALTGRLGSGLLSSATRNPPGAILAAFPLLLLIYLGAMVYAVWMMLRLGLATPAAMAENLPATDALRRSGRLTRDGKGRMFVVMLVVYLFGMVATFAGELVAMVLMGIGALVGMALHLPEPLAMALAVPAGILVFLGFLAVICLQWAGYSIALAVIFDDQRFRERGVAQLSGEPA